MFSQLCFEIFNEKFFSPSIYLVNYNIYKTKKQVYLTIQDVKTTNFKEVIQNKGELVKNCVFTFYKDSIQVKFNREYFQKNIETIRKDMLKIIFYIRNIDYKNKAIELKQNSMNKTISALDSVKSFDLNKNSNQIYNEVLKKIQIFNLNSRRFCSNFANNFNERKIIMKEASNLKLQR